jgi:hypothetical protein
MGTSYSALIERAKTSANVLEVIRGHCILCCGEDNPKLCTSGSECLLFDFRLGKNPRRAPRVLSDAQIQSLANARASKSITNA